MKVQRLALAAALIVSLGIATAGPADAVAGVGSSGATTAAHAKTRPGSGRDKRGGRSPSPPASSVPAPPDWWCAPLRASCCRSRRSRSSPPRRRSPPSRASAAHGRTHSPDLQVSSGNVVVDLLGLQPGVVVQITETTSANGTVTITITLPPPPPAQATPAPPETASGVITELDSDALTVETSDGTDLRFTWRKRTVTAQPAVL